MSDKTVASLTSSTPTIDDLTISYDNADTSELKKTTWQLVRDLFKTYMATPVYTKTSTALGWSASTNYPMIGANNFGGIGQYSNFLIDELGVFDNLTESERQELYNSGAGKTHPF